jgi:hypothetical protein
MPPTGRPTRTLTASGTWSCVAIKNNKPLNNGEYANYHARSTGSWSAFGCFTFFYRTNVNDYTGDQITEGQVSSNLRGTTLVSSSWFSATIPPGNGTWSCWVEAEEYDSSETFGHAVGLEYLGETQHRDPTEYVVHYEIPIGAQFGATFTLEGHSWSVGGAVTNPKILQVGTHFGFSGTCGIAPYFYASGLVWDASVHIDGEVMGFPIGCPATYHVARGTNGTDANVDLNFASGIHVTVSGNPNGSSGVFRSFLMGDLIQQVPSEYRIIGPVQAMQDPHTGLFTAQTHSELATNIDPLEFNPEADTVIRREKTTARFTDQGPISWSADAYVRNTGMGVSANLRTLASAVNKETVCTKLLARAAPVPGAYVRHQARRVLDACESATGWTGVVLADGVLTIDTAVQTSGRRTFGASVRTCAYRYLVAEIVAPIDNAPLQMDVAAMDGTFTLTGTGGPAGVATGVAFDLCAVDRAGPVDAKTSRWPDGGFTTAFAWGIDYTGEVTLKFPADTGVYEIRELRLERFTPAKLTLLNAESPVSETGAIDSPLVYPYVVGDVDGRRALEYYGLRIASGVTTRSTLASFKAWAESEYPGWEVDPILPGTTPLVGLGGAGVVAASEDESWIRREWNQEEPIPYQRVYAGMRCPPGSGDVLGGGGYGSPTVFRVVKILSAGYSGLLLKENLTPKVGGTVKAERLPGLEPAGSGISDARGRYYTAAPWARSAVNHRITPLAGRVADRPHADLGAALRTDRRVSFIVPPSPNLPPELASRGDGAIFGAMLGDEDYTLSVADAAAPTHFAPSRDYELDAKRVSLATGLGAAGPLWVARLAESGEADLRATPDLGATWSHVIPLPTCDDLDTCRGPDGRVYVFTAEGGTLRCRLYSPNGTAVADPWDTNVTGLSDEVRLSVTAYPRGQASFGIDLAVKDGAAAWVRTSIDGGKTFA